MYSVDDSNGEHEWIAAVDHSIYSDDDPNEKVEWIAAVDHSIYSDDDLNRDAWVEAAKRSIDRGGDLSGEGEPIDRI